MKDEENVQVPEPYSFSKGDVGLTFTHYFKLDPAKEGVIGLDLNAAIFRDEISQFALDYEKFFCATASGQNIIVSAK